MEAEFCIEALQEALARFGKPGIFNTGQGSQFTSPRSTEVLAEAGVRISMDGRGRRLDSVFVERLRRSLKYECIHLNALETGSQARASIGRRIACHDRSRPHTTLGGRIPAEVHRAHAAIEMAA